MAMVVLCCLFVATSHVQPVGLMASLLLLSFKGSNPVWRTSGHNENVDGRVQTWA